MGSPQVSAKGSFDRLLGLAYRHLPVSHSKILLEFAALALTEMRHRGTKLRAIP